MSDRIKIIRNTWKRRREDWRIITDAGLDVYINHMLLIFGIDIHFDIDIDTGEVIDVYPREVDYACQDQDDCYDAFIRIKKHMKEISKEAKE